jgi:hypothetical protein
VQAAVELDEHAVAVVRAVGDVVSDPTLPGRPRQSMGSFDIPDVADLEQ